MSDTQKYNLVEQYRLDTWCFIAFFVAAGVFAHI